MGFRTYCDNKGCRKEMEPVLNKKTDEVLCTECNKPIQSVTIFAKRQMVSLGQVLRNDNTKRQAWAVKCVSCEREGTPVLSDPKERDSNNQPVVKLLCAYCNEPITHLNKPFESMLKQTLQAQRRAGV